MKGVNNAVKLGLFNKERAEDGKIHDRILKHSLILFGGRGADVVAVLYSLSWSPGQWP